MPSPTTSKEKSKIRRYGLRRVCFVLSFCHVVFSFAVFVLFIVLFSLWGNDVIRFWKKHRSDSRDARSVFNPIVFMGVWTVLMTYAFWDYCAVGTVLTTKENYRNTGTSRNSTPQLPRIWWCRETTANERLTESCHGFCDLRAGRYLAVAFRVAISSAILTISAMTVMAGSTLEHVLEEDVRAYKVASVVLTMTVIDLPFTIGGSIFHSICTYYWIRDWYRIEIMALSLPHAEDTSEPSGESSSE